MGGNVMISRKLMGLLVPITSGNIVFAIASEDYYLLLAVENDLVTNNKAKSYKYHLRRFL
jgi:hypothetical protein